VCVCFVYVCVYTLYIYMPTLDVNVHGNRWNGSNKIAFLFLPEQKTRPNKIYTSFVVVDCVCACARTRTRSAAAVGSMNATMLPNL